MATNIFSTEVDESVLETIKRTMSVSLTEDGEAVVSFATNRGKGTGATQMGVADFTEFVSTLERYALEGIEDLPTEDLSPAETVRSTIASGDFSEVVSLLRSTLEPVLKAGERLCEPSE